MTQDRLLYVIDWQLDQEAFQHQVRDLIHRARENGKVIALPIRISPGQVMLDLMTLLLAQVNCDRCDAPCCRRNPNDAPIQLLPPEYERLVESYGDKHFIVEGDGAYLPTPCPFLRKGRHSEPNELCSIYPDRPLVCVLYPFQPGATDGTGDMMLAVASSCPEGRRIARSVYMVAWRIRHQFRLLGKENFFKGIF